MPGYSGVILLSPNPTNGVLHVQLAQKKFDRINIYNQVGVLVDRISFEQQVRKSPVSKDETVTAGIFKTASGWQDEKYYMLIDGVSPGTIIKISNPSNTRVIYAKVLGEMNGIRQNEGYNIRISNAAAAKLAITDQEKFIVKITY
jgi:hypothetical protein